MVPMSSPAPLDLTALHARIADAPQGRLRVHTVLYEDHWERVFGAGETHVFVSAYLDPADAAAAVKAATKPGDAAEYYAAEADLFVDPATGELAIVGLMVGGSCTYSYTVDAVVEALTTDRS